MSIASVKSSLEEFRTQISEEIRAAKSPKAKEHLKRVLDLANSAISELTRAENATDRVRESEES